MREGAWINAATGKFEWITEHSDWIKVPQNAAKIGLPENTLRAISEISNDYSGPRREKILRLVMNAGGGFIRVRGHRTHITFEFTVPTKTALRACSNFLGNVAGPLTALRFNNLSTNETIEFFYTEFEEQVKRHNF
ncbi:MAG: hypothetical protein ABSB87_17820 [Terriglobales bacterium]|jgi:hypothetical protein